MKDHAHDGHAYQRADLAVSVERGCIAAAVMAGIAMLIPRLTEAIRNAKKQ